MKRLSGGEQMKVIFACVHNAGRSQIAAAFFNDLAANENLQAVSGGTQPAGNVHPEVVEAMQEVGIDLSTARPVLLSDNLVGSTDLLITMGCGEACPHVPGLRRQDWPLDDPKEKSLDHVRLTRNEIKDRVEGLLEELSACCKGA